MAIGRTTPEIVLVIGCFFAADMMASRAAAQACRPLQSHLIHIDGVESFAPPFVAVGSAHQRGFAYGKQYQSAIHDFLDQEVYKRMALG